MDLVIDVVGYTTSTGLLDLVTALENAGTAGASGASGVKGDAGP